MKAKLKKTINSKGRNFKRGTTVEVLESRGIYATVILPNDDIFTVGVGDIRIPQVSHQVACKAGVAVLRGQMSIRKFVKVLGDDSPDNFTTHVVFVLQEAFERIVLPLSKVKRLIEEIEELQSAEGGAFGETEVPRGSHRGLRYLIYISGLVVWKDQNGKRRYPRWQFSSNGKPLPGVREVVDILKGKDCWQIMRFFLNPIKELDNSRALDLLRAGDVESVIAHARIYAKDNP